jgi:hypothetical protein
MLNMDKSKVSKIWESYGGILIYKHINIIANQALERKIVQHFGSTNARILQAVWAKHVQGFSIVFDKYRERAIVHQNCHNTNIIVM